MKELERILFLYNAHAGKGKIKMDLSDIVELFVNADYEVTIHSTKGRGDAKEVATAKGIDYDIIVASGGDGTLSEVINGVMTIERDKRPKIGFIPAGTTNDFAMNFKIPKEMVNAARQIVIGKPYPYDIGSFNGKYFHYVASFGLFAGVSYTTPQAFKNILGRMAYVAEGAKSLAYIQSYNMRVEFGGNVIEDEFINGMITNANSVGGFKSITGKNVTLNDGLFEVMLIKMPNNLIELQSILNCLILQDLQNNYIYKFKASHIKIKADKNVDWTLDGEFGGECIETEIINHKQAIDFLVNENIITELKENEENDFEDNALLNESNQDVFEKIVKKFERAIRGEK